MDLPVPPRLLASRPQVVALRSLALRQADWYRPLGLVEAIQGAHLEVGGSGEGRGREGRRGAAEARGVAGQGWMQQVLL